MDGPGVGGMHNLSLTVNEPLAYPTICGWTPINQTDPLPSSRSLQANTSTGVKKSGNPKVPLRRTSKRPSPKGRVRGRAIDEQQTESHVIDEVKPQPKPHDGSCARVVADHSPRKRMKVESSAPHVKIADNTMKTTNSRPSRTLCNQVLPSRSLSIQNQQIKPKQQNLTAASPALDAATSGGSDLDRGQRDAPFSDLTNVGLSKSVINENDGSSTTLEDSSDDFEVMAEQPRKCRDRRTSTALSEATGNPIKTVIASRTTLEKPKRYQGRGSEKILHDPISSTGSSRPSRRLSSDPSAASGQYQSISSPSVRTSSKRASQQITVGNQCEVQFSPTGDAIPFVRPPFPRLVLDQSPILGLSNQAALRMCFRVGEALNAAAWGLRDKIDVTVELYARVVTSVRRGRKQYFSFADLFTDKPPYLKGIWSMWNGVALWDENAKLLLGKHGQGKMCRVLGKVNKDDLDDWEISIICVWAIGWEDIGAAKASLCL